MLPTTLAASDSDGGLGVNMTFERVTPKQLPAPSPVSVENNDQSICVEKPSQNSANGDQ
jgi:hypothetical protein